MDWMKVLLLVLGFSLVGWVCLVYGVLRERWFRRKLERETEEARARILRYTVKAVANGRTTRKGYFPVLSFPVNGVETELQAREELKPEDHPEGSELTVWFDPYEPQRLHLTTDDNGIGSGMVRLSLFFILGAAVLSLIVGCFAFRR